MSSEESCSEEQDFKEWMKDNIDLNNFPDPSTFLDHRALNISTPKEFKTYWYTIHQDKITGFESFNKN